MAQKQLYKYEIALMSGRTETFITDCIVKNQSEINVFNEHGFPLGFLEIHGEIDTVFYTPISPVLPQNYQDISDGLKHFAKTHPNITANKSTKTSALNATAEQYYNK